MSLVKYKLETIYLVDTKKNSLLFTAEIKSLCAYSKLDVFHSGRDHGR